jgi:uncharacterized protein YxeA
MQLSKSKKISIIIFAILLIAGALYWWHIKNIEKEVQNPTSQEDSRLAKLKELEASSKPITATIQERTASLQQLQKSSKTVKVSTTDRLTKLQALSNQ